MIRFNCLMYKCITTVCTNSHINYIPLSSDYKATFFIASIHCLSSKFAKDSIVKDRYLTDRQKIQWLNQIKYLPLELLRY